MQKDQNCTLKKFKKIIEKLNIIINVKIKDRIEILVLFLTTFLHKITKETIEVVLMVKG